MLYWIRGAVPRRGSDIGDGMRARKFCLPETRPFWRCLGHCLSQAVVRSIFLDILHSSLDLTDRGYGVVEQNAHDHPPVAFCWRCDHAPMLRCGRRSLVQQRAYQSPGGLSTAALILGRAGKAVLGCKADGPAGGSTPPSFTGCLRVCTLNLRNERGMESIVATP